MSQPPATTFHIATAILGATLPLLFTAVGVLVGFLALSLGGMESELSTFVVLLGFFSGFVQPVWALPVAGICLAFPAGRGFAAGLGVGTLVAIALDVVLVLFLFYTIGAGMGAW
jgi:hypothetical protein